MNRDSYRYTRLAILMSAYHQARYGGSGVRPFSGFASGFDELDSKHSFIRLALRELVERVLVTIDRGGDDLEPSAVEVQITARAAVLIEQFIDRESVFLPSIEYNDDGDRTGPTPDQLLRFVDLESFENALELGL